MKKALLFLLVVVAAVGLVSCKGGDKNDKDEAGSERSGKKASADAQGGRESQIEVAKIETDMGTIMFRFFEDKAPNHVKNFKKLTREKFYNGCTFHRVIAGFLIEGGDPDFRDSEYSADNESWPDYTLESEISDLSHIRGVVAMDHCSGLPNSSGSEFFIVLEKSPDLDGHYTIFGKVISGMDVADKIAAVPRNRLNNPLEKIVMKKISIIELTEAEIEKFESGTK